jgi:DNA invertase Pin-like site-specific DNA recombinase
MKRKKTLGKPKTRKRTVTAIIGYTRVSTGKQGQSGLGLEAQQKALGDYAKLINGKILHTYREVESGKRTDREQLLRAIAHAKRSRAVLAVGDLDRMTRNLHQLTGLMESGVAFVDVFSPHDDEFTTHIKGAVAQRRLKEISRNTKRALAAYKARGGKLGASRPECRNLSQSARERGAERAAAVRAANADAAYVDLIPQLREWKAAGLSLIAIAERLNADGHTTRRGKPWNHVQVGRVLQRA